MIEKGADYDQTEAYGNGFKALPKGGYICRIIKAEELKDKNGNPMVHIAFDIAHGEYKDYFDNLFQSRKKKAKDQFKEAKWPFEGQSWIQTQDYEDNRKTSRKFKGFCTALEDSGTQVWNGNKFNLPALSGAYVGIVYQSQEQEYEGKTSWRAVPWGFRSVQAIESGDFFVPDDKPLEKKKEEYDAPGFSQLDEDSIPF